jgi:predicted nucleic acid-binding protein
MNAALVDTDVVSMIFEGDTRVLAYRSQTRKLEPAQHPARYTVLPISRELHGRSAEVSVAGKRSGRPIQTADAWIAASALHYPAPSITNNRDDYSVVDGSVLPLA